MHFVISTAIKKQMQKKQQKNERKMYVHRKII